MQKEPSASWNPTRLDARRFAESGGDVGGELPVSALERLMVDLCAQEPSAANPVVRWQARGELRPDARGVTSAPWLHLQAGVEVPLTCQRCLGPVPTPLHLDSHTIPARGDEPEHEHLDVRYLFVALDAEALSHDPAESHGAQWLSWDEALAKADEPAMKRLLTKGKAWAAKR